jgi:hypothetical protein
MTPYDDNYSTCKETSATLRIFSDSIDPSAITSMIGTNPTESYAKGDKYGKKLLTRKCNGWLLDTRGLIESKDCRRHIDWILSKISECDDGLAKLKSTGAEIDISCYWVSSGQGGPTLSPLQMAELARLDIEIWWDIYFDQQINQE